MDALGPTGTLINVARGSVVDEPELVTALSEGRLAVPLSMYSPTSREYRRRWSTWKTSYFSRTWGVRRWRRAAPWESWSWKPEAALRGRTGSNPRDAVISASPLRKIENNLHSESYR